MTTPGIPLCRINCDSSRATSRIEPRLSKSASASLRSRAETAVVMVCHQGNTSENLGRTPSYRGDDFTGRVGEPVRRDDLAAALLQERPAEVGIGPLETDDQGNSEVDLVVGSQERGGNDIAHHDTAEDVDQHGLDIR